MSLAYDRSHELQQENFVMHVFVNKATKDLGKKYPYFTWFVRQTKILEGQAYLAKSKRLFFSKVK